MTKIRLLPIAALQLGLLFSQASWAQTTATDAWVRGTVAQQKATGLFVTLTSASGGTLVSAASPVAGVVEIHEMAMDGNVMKMRALPQGLALPAGQAVTLKPGGYHVMMMDLKQPLKAGDLVDVTLVVQDGKGQRETLQLQAPVKALGAPGMAGQATEHGKHKH